MALDVGLGHAALVGPLTTRGRPPSAASAFRSIIGASAAIRRAVQMAGRVAEHPTTTVLIQGKAGTGKELFARGIHYASANGGDPFVAVNCAGLTPAMVETELFGMEEWDSQGAQREQRGLLELAGCGTVFLDEVAELPATLQSKLLLVLEDRRVRRIGGFQERPIHCRVAAATSHDLQMLVNAGEFREDFFYRLSVFRIELPPLIERDGDVDLLARYFVEAICREQGIAPKELTPATAQVLSGHHWPGNVRELRLAIQRAVERARGDQIEPHHLVLQQRSMVSALTLVESERARAAEADDDRRVVPPVRLHATVFGEKTGSNGAALSAAGPCAIAGTPPEVEALIAEARAAERLGWWGVARDLYQQGLFFLSRSDHAPLAASLLRWTGNTYRTEADGEAAMDCYIASLAVAELNGSRIDMAHACNCMGAVRQSWGQLDDADELYGRALELAEAAGDERLLAMLDQNLGVVANIRGDLQGALAYYERSFERYRALNAEEKLCQVLNNLGMIYTDLGRLNEAELKLDHAAELADQVADLPVRVMVEVNRTELYLLMGNLFRARESCDTAFEMASRVEHRLGLGEVYKNYGMIYRDMTKYSLAETHLMTALEIAESYSNPLLAAEVQRELAHVYRHQDRNQEALQALNYAHRIFRDLRASRELAEVDQSMGELEVIYLDVVRKWGESIESKDHYTAGHCERVADYACALAEAVGFDRETLTWFRMGAFLHDVGKTVVPPEILNKQGRLSAEEWEIMRSHTVRGAELLSAVDFPWDVRPMVRGHHEHWDGSGYPDKLAGSAIPLPARILCVADVFDALTTDRAYRPAYTWEEALRIMEEDAGRVFDPALFEIFNRLMLLRVG